MCGIAGMNIGQLEGKTLNSRKLASELLMQIVQRGKDATGAAWVQKGETEREVWYSKMAAPAHRFLETGGLKQMPNRSRNVLLHTRYATQGKPSINDNNHPIIVGGLVGVHNGHISNDNEIIRDGKFERVGQVDSEAAFWLLSSIKDPKEALIELRGTAALAWIHVNDPTVLHLARCSGSPLHVCQTELGSTVFASTDGHLSQALAKQGIKAMTKWDVPEWTYLTIKSGAIVDWVDIPKPKVPVVFEKPNAFGANWYSMPSLPSQGDDKRKMKEFGWL